MISWEDAGDDSREAELEEEVELSHVETGERRTSYGSNKIGGGDDRGEELKRTVGCPDWRLPLSVRNESNDEDDVSGKTDVDIAVGDGCSWGSGADTAC